MHFTTSTNGEYQASQIMTENLFSVFTKCPPGFILPVLYFFSGSGENVLLGCKTRDKSNVTFDWLDICQLDIWHGGKKLEGSGENVFPGDARSEVV